jgi:alcohol dehydrogenase class IV
MSLNFFLPTKVLLDEDCVKRNAPLFKELGKKALLVTGRHSARANGSLQDVTDSLASQSLEWILFDRVETNPSIATVREGAAFAKENGADFVIGIGGGSPMDAAKAIALLACQDLSDDELFAGRYTSEVLPLVLLPTTAGTGSEVTQYSILTNDRAQTKTSIATPLLFPKIAMVDAKYTVGLPLKTTINTAIDALSHSIEGMLSIKANSLIDLLAAESIAKIAGSFDKLLSGKVDAACRAELIYASTLGGIVIAHTGTTAVHSMGYSLTYFQHIDHGRANGLLLAAFFSFIEKQNPAVIRRLLDIMRLADTSAFKSVLDRLLGEKESITVEHLEKFAGISIKAKNISNCTIVPTQKDLYNLYVESFS